CSTLFVLCNDVPLGLLLLIKEAIRTTGKTPQDAQVVKRVAFPVFLPSNGKVIVLEVVKVNKREAWKILDGFTCLNTGAVRNIPNRRDDGGDGMPKLRGCLKNGSILQLNVIFKLRNVACLDDMP